MTGMFPSLGGSQVWPLTSEIIKKENKNVTFSPNGAKISQTEMYTESVW